MSEYSTETEVLMRNYPEFFQTMLDKMEQEVKFMRKKFEKIKKDVIR